MSGPGPQSDARGMPAASTAQAGGTAAPADGTSPSRPSAVALSYDPDDAAPRVVAKGYGTVAESIIRCAREHGLHVHESPELVGLLMQVDLDRHIPPQLYAAIAELLAWLYSLEAGAGNGAASSRNPAAEARQDPSNRHGIARKLDQQGNRPAGKSSRKSIA